jgi:hypothetical protein
MRSTVLALALGVLLFSAPAVRAAQDPEKQDAKARIPQSGDTITVTGCIAGSTIQDLDTGYTFRLKGDKALLKSIDKEHKGHSDELTGVLRSSLQTGDMKSRQVGRTTITVGMSESRAGGAPRELNPVLEVKSITHRPATCEK